MSQRKIDVIFYAPGYDDFGTSIIVTRITAAQLKQLQENIATAKLPENSCMSSLSVKYEDKMSFLDGGACRDKITGRRRTLEISDLFYRCEFKDFTPTCGKCHGKNPTAIMRHCAKNLRAGRCRDEFMRNTIGAVLFPQFYAKDKQK